MGISMNWPESIGFLRHADSQRNAIMRAAKAGKARPEHKEYRLKVAEHLVDLTETGIRQGTAAGRGIWQRFPHIDAAFHSGYVRNEKTLRLALNAAYGDRFPDTIPVFEDILLREREPGRPFTMELEEELRTFPWWEAHFKMNGRMFSRPDAGESVAMASDRMNTFLLKLRLDWAGKHVLVGMHGRMIAIARMILEGRSIAEMEHFVRDGNPERPKNAGLTIYRYSAETRRMALSEYNVPCGYKIPEAS